MFKFQDNFKHVGVKKELMSYEKAFIFHWKNTVIFRTKITLCNWILCEILFVKLKISKSLDTQSSHIAPKQEGLRINKFCSIYRFEISSHHKIDEDYDFKILVL